MPKIDLLDEFADLLATKIAARLGAKVSAAEEEEEEEEEEEAPPPKAKGKAPAKAAPAAKGKAAPPAKGKAAAKAKAPDITEVRNILREVSTKLGRDAAKGLLAEFDAKLVTDVEEGDYAELVKAAQEALAEAGDEDEDEEEDI